MRKIESSILSNQSLATALLCHTYTADAARAIYIRLTAAQVQGNGTYRAYVTLQRLGTGAEFEIQPRTESSVASGVTSIGFTTITIPVESTDKLRVYLIGLSTDTTTPDVTTDIFEADYARPLTPGQHGTNIDASGRVLLQPDQPGVTIPEVDLVNGVDPAVASDIADAIGVLPVILTQTPGAISAAVQGDRINITRDSEFIARLYITGGISSTRDDLLFTVKTPKKKDAGAADSEAIIQISEVGGLLYLNADEGEIAEGSLTVVDESNGDGNGVVDLVLSSWAAAQLQKYSGYAWDIKEIEAGADLARVEGLLDVRSSVTRTISS